MSLYEFKYILKFKDKIIHSIISNSKIKIKIYYHNTHITAYNILFVITKMKNTLQYFQDPV